MTYDFDRELGIEESLEAQGNPARREDKPQCTCYTTTDGAWLMNPLCPLHGVPVPVIAAKRPDAATRFTRWRDNDIQETECAG